jgi:uncharacterized membrane protein YbaN (DUF454 family)
MDRGSMLTRIATLLFWRALALVCLALGVVGVFLPVLATTPFLLVAAWAGGKGWPALEAWLLAHPHLGPPIRRWRDHRAVPRAAKWAASAGILSTSALLALSQAPLALKIGVPLLLLAVAWWLWRRPEL